MAPTLTVGKPLARLALLMTGVSANNLLDVDMYIIGQ